MMRSQYGKLKSVFGMAKTVGSGDSTTSAIDLQGFQSCMLNIVAGVFNFTSTNKVTLTLLESSDNTTYGTVAYADCENLEGTATFRVWDASATDASTVTSIFYRGTKRYVKAVFAEGGTVSVAMGAEFVLGDSHNKPSVD